jgi:hypothetical protein
MEPFGLLTWGVALGAIGFNVGIWAVGAYRIRRWRSRRRRNLQPERWPAVHVFVCLKGRLPELRQTVLALDLQDYPGDYRVTLVTEGAAPRDEAAAALAAVLPVTRRCDHAVAGRVLDSGARCAQKNFNLLAGIRHAEATRPGIDVYAFCDGDLHVQGDWLRELVRPIAVRESDATTSLHYATATERRLLGALHGMVESAQSLAAIVCRAATWGGSMAIARTSFHRLGLPEVWSRTCVDDVTMSRVLREARISVTPVPQFLVRAGSDIGSYRSFVRWLGRQFFFVKVYLPSRWHLLWMKCALDVAVLWIAAFHVSHRVLRGEWAPGGAEAAGIAVAATAVALGAFHVFRYLLPDPPPLRDWLGATLLVHGAGVLACADATLRRKRLIWRDLAYHLERGGRVVTVTESRQAAPPAAAAVPVGPVGPVAPDEPLPEEAVA